MIPGITGTVGGQTVTLGDTIDPFANANATDGNSLGSAANAVSPIAEISLSGGGGSLSLSGNNGTTLADNGNGNYTLSVNVPASDTLDNVATITTALHGLAFIPNTDGTTTFSVTMTDKYGENSSDNKTTVTASGSGSPASVPNAATTPSTDNTLLASGDGHQVVANAVTFRDPLTLASGDIDLNKLVSIDSVSFAKDMMTVWNGSASESFHITGDSSAWTAVQTPIGVSVYTNGDTSHPTGTVLPIHT